MLSNDDIEKELQEKGLNAPRLTPSMIEDTVLATQYYIFPGTFLIVCCLTLKNGYNVVGKAAPVSADNFDAKIGEKIAKQDALNQIWALEGYLLKTKLKEQT